MAGTNKMKDINQVHSNAHVARADAMLRSAKEIQQTGHAARAMVRRGAEITADVARWSIKTGVDAMCQVGDAASHAMHQNTQAVVETQRQIGQDAAKRFDTISHALSQAALDSAEDMNWLLAMPDVPRIGLRDMQQGMMDLADGMTQLNLRVMQGQIRLSNPAAAFELQQQLMREYLDAMMQGAGTAAQAVRNTADQTTHPLQEHVDHQAPRQQQAASKPRRTPKHGKVLIVDDEADVSRVAAAFLNKAGFEVTTVSGDEALAKLGNGSTYEALVTDCAMQGTNGVDLVLHARELNPRLPALVITGYAGAEGLDRLPSNVTVLRKPFQRDDLVRRVGTLVKGTTPVFGASLG